jgi:asparagine synthase (glutamine-hydrolysing)
MGFSLSANDGSLADESSFVSAIEDMYGVAIQKFSFDPVDLARGAADSTRISELPMASNQWSNIESIYSTARDSGARVLLTGMFADELMFDMAYLTDLVDHGRWWTARRHLNEIPEWFQDAGPAWYRAEFRRDLVRQHVPALAAHVLRRLRVLLSQPPPNNPFWSPAFRRQAIVARAQPFPGRRTFGSLQVRSLYRQVRGSYPRLRMEWENKIGAAFGLEVAMPFLDRDLVAFLMSVPGHVQTRGGIPKALIRSGLASTLPPSVADRRWKADFADGLAERWLVDWDDCRQLIQGKGLAAAYDLVEGAALEEGLDALRDRVRAKDWAAVRGMLELVGLESWLDAFVGAGV